MGQEGGRREVRRKGRRKRKKSVRRVYRIIRSTQLPGMTS
jgi:hypothetical protein